MKDFILSVNQSKLMYNKHKWKTITKSRKASKKVRNTDWKRKTKDEWFDIDIAKQSYTYKETACKNWLIKIKDNDIRENLMFKAERKA